MEADFIVVELKTCTRLVRVADGARVRHQLLGAERPLARAIRQPIACIQMNCFKNLNMQVIDVVLTVFVVSQPFVHLRAI